jgi:hypothetical protein
MQIPDNALDPEQKPLWHTWQERRRSADRQADRRMTLLCLALALILLACTLYYAFRAKLLFDSDQQQRAGVCDYSLFQSMHSSCATRLQFPIGRERDVGFRLSSGQERRKQTTTNTKHNLDRSLRQLTSSATDFFAEFPRLLSADLDVALFGAGRC